MDDDYPKTLLEMENRFRNRGRLSRVSDKAAVAGGLHLPSLPGKCRLGGSTAPLDVPGLSTPVYRDRRHSF